jgi:protein-disulfide isomerase
MHLPLSDRSRLLALCLIAPLVVVAATAQVSVPPNQVTPFTDTSILKPPPGVKVAVLEWEDLECPMCAHAFPIVHTALKEYAARGIHIPLLRYDYHIPGHIWSQQAALYARYLQDKVSPELATDYRRQVFASQFRISSQDDLKRFTQKFFTDHGKQVPFLLDPGEQLEREVNADRDAGVKLGVAHTPTIIVVTNKSWIQVEDVTQLDTAIDMAEASVAAKK